MIRVSQLVERRRSVQLDDRRCVVRAPTVAAVFEFLGLFGGELLSLWRAYRKDPAPWESGTMAATRIDFAFNDPARLRRLVEHVAVTDPDQIPDRHLAVVAWESVRLLDDPRALLDQFNLDSIGQEKPEDAADADEESTPEGIEPQALAIIEVARQFRVPPHQVMTWPWEEYFAVIQASNAASGLDPETLEAPPLDPAMANRLRTIGLGVEN